MQKVHATRFVLVNIYSTVNILSAQKTTLIRHCVGYEFVGQRTDLITNFFINERKTHCKT